MEVKQLKICKLKRFVFNDNKGYLLSSLCINQN